MGENPFKSVACEFDLEHAAGGSEADMMHSKNKASEMADSLWKQKKFHGEFPPPP